MRFFILLFLSFNLFSQTPPNYKNEKKIPDKETILYETYDNGKTGTIKISLNKDTIGYRITYSSDRFIEVILDTSNLQTLYLNKFVEGKWELTINRKGMLFEVNYKNNKRTYKEEPVFDRHTLDFVLRGFEYYLGFQKRIRLNVPEFMVVNADIKVIGEEYVLVPIGEIACWKIEMHPRIIFIKKRFFFWIEKEYPHRFVKYQDSEGKNQIILKEYNIN
ncbi:MAG: hypothetical protein ABIL70_00555 [candidate division WOR-3 bacterium]